MDAFNNKFIKYVEDIKNGELMSIELDEYVLESSNNSVFSTSIKHLMNHEDEYVKILSSKYAYDYNIDKKGAFLNSKSILRKSKDFNCKIEAKYIYDKHKRRHIRKLFSAMKILRNK